MIACVIPARAGSKSIPHKNTALVGGKPLIAWSIEHAIESQLVDDVCVATDCKLVAEVANQYDVRVYWRSRESATDEAPSEAVLTEVVQSRYATAEAIVFLQATSPLRQPEDVDNAIRKYRYANCDSLFSARHLEGFTWESKLNGPVLPCHRKRPRRQDNPMDRYEENGSIYVFPPETLFRGSRHGLRPAVYLMHALDSFQVDGPEDIELLESLMRLRCDRHTAVAS
jgi:N-acylneuraminate cytidylyltransferase